MEGEADSLLRLCASGQTLAQRSATARAARCVCQQQSSRTEEYKHGRHPSQAGTELGLYKERMSSTAHSLLGPFKDS